MNTTKRFYLHACLSSAVLTCAAGVLAAPPDTGASAATPATAPAPAAAPRSGADFGAAVTVDKLDKERGKDPAVSGEANLGGVVTGNSASSVTTGSNAIDTGSFANMSGLPVVIQNTGANVMIQNATVINVLFK